MKTITKTNAIISIFNERQRLCAYKALIIFFILLCASPALCFQAHSRLDPRVDPEDTPIFEGVILNGGNITSASAINLKPSGDNDDYISFSTAGDLPLINIIGGDNLHFLGSGVSTSLKLMSDSATIVSSWTWDGIGGITSLISSKHLALSSGDNGNITLSPDGTGVVNINSDANITGVLTVEGLGTGGRTDYDLNVGSTDYGIIRTGDGIVGITAFKAGFIDLDGTMIFQNAGGPVTGDIEFIWVESGGDTCRFALPKAGKFLATYNPRSFLIAGPADPNTNFVSVLYWRTEHNIFHNIDCDTSGVGADLGVQNDLEVEGDLFTDSIKESTTGAGITFNGFDVLGVGSLTSTGDITLDSDSSVVRFGDDQDWDVGYNSGTGDLDITRNQGNTSDVVKLNAGIDIAMTATEAANFDPIKSVLTLDGNTARSRGIVSLVLLETASGTAVGELDAFFGRVDMKAASSVDVTEVNTARFDFRTNGDYTGNIGTLNYINVDTDAQQTTTGTIDVWNGVRVGASAVENVNTKHGILIGDITNADVDNFAIKTGLGLVSFGDSLAIGGSGLDMNGGDITELDNLTMNGQFTDGVLIIESGSITSAVNGTFSGTLQAEQVTSTDDMTMQGHLFTLGDNTDTDIILRFDGSTNDVDLTYEPDVDRFDYKASDLISTGTLKLTNSTAGGLSIKTVATTPGSRGLLEALSSVGTPLNETVTNSAIAGLAFFDPVGINSANGPFRAGLFNNNTTGEVDTSGSVYVGLGGNASTVLTNKAGEFNSVTIQGLNFIAQNEEDWINTHAFLESTLTVSGMELVGRLGSSGKEISGPVNTVVHGVNTTVQMLGEYSSSLDGNVYGMKITTTDSLDDASTGDINAYGLHITAAASDTHGGGGVLTSWGIFQSSDVINAINGNLRIGDTAAPTNTLEVNGVSQLGDGGTATFFEVDATGNSFWVGDSTGLPYGHMYVDGAQVIRVALTLNTPAEVEGDGTGGTAPAEDGWLAGDLNLITFPTGGTEHYITVTKPGVYCINWNLSFTMVTGAANTQIHGGLAVDGTAIRDKCESHRTISNNTDTGNMAGSCMVDLPNGTEELSLWLENTTNNNDAEVNHGSLVAVMVGGT